MVGGRGEHAAAVALPFGSLGRIGPPYDDYAEAPGITNYMFSSSEGNECPEHSTEVSGAEECQAAAEVLLAGNSAIWWTGVQNKSTRPRGCYLFTMTSDVVNYNEHPTGAGAKYMYKICKADFLFGAYESTTCPSGSAPIANATACRSAVEAVMGPLISWAGVQNDADKPRGCYVFFFTSPMAYYNEHPEGTGKAYHSVVCADAVSKMVDLVADVQNAVGALGEAIDALQ